MDALGISRQIYDELTSRVQSDPPSVRAWDGTTWGPTDAPATLVLRHPGALRAMLLPLSDLSAGEAYIYDDIDIEGDIFSMLDFAFSARDARPNLLELVSLYRMLRSLPGDSRKARANRPRVTGARRSLRRDRNAVSYHYDIGNDFFAQYLDPAMVYSSGVFLFDDDTLEEAQERKLDLICRKLELGPNKHFLDVGCGWGALVIHAALEYGVNALGVTLSAEQAHYATTAAKEAGVEDQVTILQRDYREVEGTFDAIASVGMFEHVGADQLGTYFSHLRALLAGGGLLLNHGIVTRDKRKPPVRRGKPNFIDTYVFPDGELETIDRVVAAAEGGGFEVRDAESLRTSYARTLRHWVANLEAQHEVAAAATNETVYRIWRAYMAGSAVGFETGRLSIYQLLLAETTTPWVFGRKRLLAADDRERPR